MAPSAGVLRLTRVAFFAVTAVGLASAAHSAAGERLPVIAAICCVPAVMLVVNLMAGRRRGAASLLACMGLTQVVLHLVLMAASVQTCAAMPAMHMASGGPHAHLAERCAGAAAGGPSAGLSGVPPVGGGLLMLPSVPMLVAHALATLVLVALLAHGERALWALTGCLSFRFAIPAAPVPLPAGRRPPVPPRCAVACPRTVHLRAVRRRGPPVLAGL